MKYFATAFITAILFLIFMIFILATVGCLAYFLVYILENPERPFNIISIPFFLISAVLSILIFKIGVYFDREEKEKAKKKYYDENINPDNAEILRFYRKNSGVNVCKFNDKGTSLAFIDERIWCLFKRDGEKILLFHPPEIEIHRVNTKFIELVKAEDLPRI